MLWDRWFGSQKTFTNSGSVQGGSKSGVVCQVIDRRVRELLVETDFLPLDTSAASIKSNNYK